MIYLKVLVRAGHRFISCCYKYFRGGCGSFTRSAWDRDWLTKRSRLKLPALPSTCYAYPKARYLILRVCILRLVRQLHRSRGQHHFGYIHSSRVKHNTQVAYTNLTTLLSAHQMHIHEQLFKPLRSGHLGRK